eukprot:1383999-Pleurochrysis_carterae.AAC.1
MQIAPWTIHDSCNYNLLTKLVFRKEGATLLLGATIKHLQISIGNTSAWGKPTAARALINSLIEDTICIITIRSDADFTAGTCLCAVVAAYVGELLFARLPYYMWKPVIENINVYR